MKLPLLTLIVAVGLLAGCSTSNINTVSRSESQATPEMVGDKRIITDASLGKMIRIVGVNEATVSGNLKKIQVTLENAKNDPRTISYKFEWVDKDGMATGGLGEMWKPLQFGGRETKTVSAVATSPRAVDFTLKLAEAR